VLTETTDELGVKGTPEEDDDARRGAEGLDGGAGISMGG
jgi:hypothetical protein